MSLGPTLYDDVDGRYRGMDNQVHTLKAGERNFSTFSLWDTFRAAHPAYTLIEQERVPLWVNTLIRTYCWILILRDEGLVNGLLRQTGVISQPLPLLYNDGSILLGLVYTFLPFMVLPIYSTLERIDPRLIEAAHDLYASRAAVFRRIVWPLARPGALAGATLVFAPALGSFLAPDLLGGGKKLLIGSLIQMQFTSSRNWPFGAALSTVVTVVVLAVFVIRSRKAQEAPR
jgi:spermidine/putrescine transport system permease protein